MANSNGWGDGAANNAIGWGQGANNAIGWGDIHADSWAGLTDIVGAPTTDPDAQAFITAAAITDPTQQAAINTLVVDLKGYSIWTKMKALYPFVGGTSTTHKYNLKDPQDTDAAFRLVFNGGVTHNSNGVTFNGTNGYADTRLSPNSILLQNNNSISVYSRADVLGNNYFGVGTPNWFILGRFGFTVEYWANASSPLAPNSTFTSFITGTRRSSTDVELYKEGVSISTGSRTSQALPVNNFWLGGANDGGSLSLKMNLQCAFFSLGDGLTDTEAANFYTAVQNFNTALARQV